jgi:hypothetical protein
MYIQLLTSIVRSNLLKKDFAGSGTRIQFKETKGADLSKSELQIRIRFICCWIRIKNPDLDLDVKISLQFEAMKSSCNMFEDYDILGLRIQTF